MGLFKIAKKILNNSAPQPQKNKDHDVRQTRRCACGGYMFASRTKGKLICSQCGDRKILY